MDRIYERKRAALVDLNGTALNASRRRLREADPEEQPEEKAAGAARVAFRRVFPMRRRRFPGREGGDAHR